MSKWHWTVAAWFGVGVMIFVWVMYLTVHLIAVDQERYMAKLEACKSAPDIATCINLTTMGNN